MSEKEAEFSVRTNNVLIFNYKSEEVVEWGDYKVISAQSHYSLVE